jgi:hypothetical protein
MKALACTCRGRGTCSACAYFDRAIRNNADRQLQRQQGRRAVPNDDRLDQLEQHIARLQAALLHEGVLPRWA